MPARAVAPTGTPVRVSGSVVEALKKLPRNRAQSVAAAIQRIGPDVGRPLKIQQPGGAKGPYLAITPDDDAAPVVIYRRLASDEDEGYLVTALVGRDEYAGYERAERRGILDTPVGRFLMGVAAGAVTYGLLRSGRSANR